MMRFTAGSAARRSWQRDLSRAARILAVLALSACSVNRPEPIACNVEPYLVPIEEPSLRAAGLSVAASPMSAYERAVLGSLEQAVAPPPSGPATGLLRGAAVAPKTLALSGGGPWGAYGAGFMKAWRDELGSFPRFATVTGVSTGALQATFAFLGGEQLDRLDRLYRNVSDDDIYAARNSVSAVLWRNAFNSLDPLRDLIHREIFENGLIGEVEAEARLGRKLFVGVVDLDSGGLFAADLTAVASDGALAPAEREACYTEFLAASAAVPVAFDPVATRDDALSRQRLLVDGGVRAAAFIESTERAVAAMAERRGRTGSAFQGETVVVMNGTLEMCPETTEGGLLSIARRSVSTLISQNDRNSLANILVRRSNDGQCTRYTHVRFAEELCSVQVDTTTFDPAFMNDLANRGRERWQAGRPFESVGACAGLPR